jgi:hypothetical protein
MTKQFPKTLFVKVEESTPADYFLADEGLDGMVEVGQRVRIAVYKLSHIDTVEGMVQVIPPAKRKR